MLFVPGHQKHYGPADSSLLELLPPRMCTNYRPSPQFGHRDQLSWPVIKCTICCHRAYSTMTGVVLFFQDIWKKKQYMLPVSDLEGGQTILSRQPGQIYLLCTACTRCPLDTQISPIVSQQSQMLSLAQPLFQLLVLYKSEIPFPAIFLFP